MLSGMLFKVSLRSLMANKMRSFLAMLGIIIGVGAVISMLAMGAGAQKQVMDRVTAMGTNLLIIRPGAARRGGVRGAARQSLTLADAQAVAEEIRGIEAVTPVVSGRQQVSWFAQNTNTTITGAASTYFMVRGFEIARGRNFTDLEEETGARVAILGHTTAGDLFGHRDPLGETIRVGTVNCRVIGVLREKGDQGWFDPDDMVVMPYRAAMARITGQTWLNEIDVLALDDADMSKVEADITALLRTRHRIQPGEEDDFNVRNQAEMIEVATGVTRTFTFLLGGIASISLVVGGIGIMNVMLVTVTERTREIGVRKAIGAKRRDILSQFLIESILVSGAGGIIGILVGVWVADLLDRMTTYTTLIELNSIILALVVSVSVGVFFGYYPARRAAVLDPIDALRYE